MARYLLRRTVILVVSLLTAMVVIFLLLRALPGDPANALLSVNATPEQIAAARAQVGADLPLHEQFVDWFLGMITLDLGSSFISTLPVGPEIASRLAVTIPLTFLAFGLAFVLSLLIGFVAAVQGRPLVRRRPVRLLAAVHRDPGVLGGDPAHQRLLPAAPRATRRRIPARGLVRPGQTRSRTSRCRC